MQSLSYKKYYFIFFDLMYSSIAEAAFFPAPIASITVAAPVTASPPANTPSRVVETVSSPTTRQPLLFASSPGVVERIKGLGDVPSAIITVSTSRINSLPGIAIGLRLPDASGSQLHSDTFNGRNMSRRFPVTVCTSDNFDRIA